MRRPSAILLCGFVLGALGVVAGCGSTAADATRTSETSAPPTAAATAGASRAATPPAPSRRPSGIGAVYADLDEPPPLREAGGSDVTPELLQRLWNPAAAVNPFAAAFDTLPPPVVAGGRRTITVSAA